MSSICQNPHGLAENIQCKARFFWLMGEDPPTAVIRFCALCHRDRPDRHLLRLPVRWLRPSHRETPPPPEPGNHPAHRQDDRRGNHSLQHWHLITPLSAQWTANPLGLIFTGTTGFAIHWNHWVCYPLEPLGLILTGFVFTGPTRFDIHWV